MDARSTKRRRNEVTSTIQNPNSLPSSAQYHSDLIVSSLLSLRSLSSSPRPIRRSFDRAFDKAVASDSDQDRLMDRTVEIASLLLESAKRCFRKRATVHNSLSWSFPPELTIKVFSMLDKKSLMQAMVCCTMFHKFAMEPLCYSHIELKDENKVNDRVVRTMIRRAGNKLRSLELAHVASPDIYAMCLLTESCLNPLFKNHSFIGNHLRSLHLYDLESMYGDSGIAALSACPNLTDLKIVGLGFTHYLFESLKLSRKIEQLFLEARDYHCGIVGNGRLVELVNSLPNLTSLTLIGFRVDDARALMLIKRSRKLKLMNLSGTSRIMGHFLSDLGHSFKDSRLETLILRHCTSLREIEVMQFLNSLLTGNLRFIRHVDISNISGLVCDGGTVSKKPNFPLEKLKEGRPNVKFVADFGFSSSRSERLLPGNSYFMDVDYDDDEDDEDDEYYDGDDHDGWLESDDDDDEDDHDDDEDDED